MVWPAGTLAAGVALGFGLGVSMGPASESPGATRVALPPFSGGLSGEEANLDAASAPAWIRHAVAIPDPGRAPMIAIVIDDVGVDKARSKRVIALDGPLTMAMMPYASELDQRVAEARAKGHEIIVHIPMEPQDDAADPGPRYLAMGQDDAAFLATLDWNLGRVNGYVGISNHMGSRYTEDEPRMRRLLAEVRARGLLFLDSVTTGASVGDRLAGEIGVPHARRDVFLDNERNVSEIRQRLAELEIRARRHGYAVGIGHPHDAMIEALRTWIAEAPKRGFVLVPISAVVRKRMEQAARDLARR